MLTKLGNEQGYLKAGLLGYAKSGKTYTATKLAIGVKKYFKLTGPIAFFDTESGSNYVSEMVKAETGEDLLGVRARSFKELIQFGKDCLEAKVSVAVVDSVSHPWKELCESYLVQLNQRRRERNFAPLMKLEFQNWSQIKSMWEEWPNFFLNSALHIIVCGRAAGIWEMEKDPETGRKELIQTGVKMRVETEFSFESSLLVELEREQVPDGNGGFRITHQATVIGDRFGVLDGKTCQNPTFEFFLPHIQKLNPGAHAPVNVANKTDTGADVEGSGEWERERKARTIYAEEIMGCIVSKYPGQTAQEKKIKADLIQKFFGTRSWSKVEGMNSEDLKKGLEMLRMELGDEPVPEVPKEEDQVPGAEVIPTPSPEAAKGAISGIRALMGAQKIVESRFLGMLGELGTIPRGLQTLEEVQLTATEGTLDLILNEWGPFTKAYKDAIKS